MPLADPRLLATQPRILMCAPDFYGIEYEINAWMSRARPSDKALANLQWAQLRHLLQELGAQIELVPPVAGLPDLVFTANAAMIFGNRAILSRFKHDERQREVPHFETCLRQLGFEIDHVPADVHFEGAGDALFCGDPLFAGYRKRSDSRGHQWIAQLLGVQVLPLELVDSYYYHLDTCFCPVAPGTAIWYPEAFDAYGQQVIQMNVARLIRVVPEEAQRFACNAVVVGKTVITNTGCPSLHHQLQAAGFATRETPLDEFIKAGGSAKCLTLRLDGEEAASWKNRPAVSGNPPG